MKQINRLTVPPYGFAQGMEAGARKFLATCGEFWAFDVGDIIVAEGAHHSSLFMVIQGVLSQRRQIDDHSFAEFKPVKRGRFFGELNLFHPVGARATVIAATPGEFWKIDRVQLDAIFDNDPLIARRLLTWLCGQMARRLRRADERYLLTKAEYNQLIDIMDDHDEIEPPHDEAEQDEPEASLDTVLLEPAPTTP